MTADPSALTRTFHGPRPAIVCLCGSTRFGEEFRRANLRETLAGRIVLSIGCDTKTDGDLLAAFEAGGTLEQIKTDLDELHKRKIDLCDEILVVSDPSGYVGESTYGEIVYAEKHGKAVRWTEPAAQVSYRALEQDEAQ